MTSAFGHRVQPGLYSKTMPQEQNIGGEQGGAKKEKNSKGDERFLPVLYVCLCEKMSVLVCGICVCLYEDV